MHRIFIICLSIIACLFVSAQETKWQVYPAYKYPVQCINADGSLFVIMTRGETNGDFNGNVITSVGNLVRYDLEDGSVRTYDCLHDLNGQHIYDIFYNKSSDCLVLVYDDSNIDILSLSDETVVNVTALRDKSITVNSAFSEGSFTYLCTSAGIVRLDVVNAVVTDTYRFSSDVSSMCRCNGYYYIGTTSALQRVPCGCSLYDSQKRETVVPRQTYALATVGDTLYTLLNDPDAVRNFQYIDTDDQQLTIHNTGWGFTNMRQGKDCVIAYSGLCATFCDATGIYFYDKYSPGILDVNVTTAKEIWAIDKDYNLKHGQMDFTLANPRIEFSDAAVTFNINSPKRDASYRLRYDSQNRLLVAGGIIPLDVGNFNMPGTAMMMDPDGSWKSFDEETQKKRYPYLNHFNLVSLIEDPYNSNHFYAAVSRNGLEEYQLDSEGNPVFKCLHNADNSPLRIIKVNEGLSHDDAANYCGCYGLRFDTNGNLWIAQEMVDTIIRIRHSETEWIPLYYPEIKLADHPLDYLFSKSGVQFLINTRNKNKGFFGFNTNGTLNYVDDDQHCLRSTITNQNGTSYTPETFYCMTEDKDNQIWVGTDKGLFVIEDPTQWFDTNFRFKQIIRNRDDGSGLADYLLSDTHVTCVTVDGANRKWIGTKTEGIYLLSSDGQETIHHFTAADSPLISDYIYSIAINPKTGLVMIGTDKGLCSYDEGVAESKEDLLSDNVHVYPNPVRPSTNSMVTVDGLTPQAEIKILSSTGQCVAGGQSTGGSFHWDLHDSAGNIVSSGVYHLIINTVDGSPVITKRLIVIR